MKLLSIRSYFSLSNILNMSEKEIRERLQEVFRENFNDQELLISDSMNADDIEEWDSLSHITLIVSTEEAFGIRFNHSEIAKLRNIGEFKSLISNKLK